MSVFKGVGKEGGPFRGPKRPRFPGCPLKGFQPSGSYPQATDKFGKRCDWNTCCDDHAGNMFGMSLDTSSCKQTIALQTAERMQQALDHCKLLRHELLHINQQQACQNLPKKRNVSHYMTSLGLKKTSTFGIT